MTFILQKKKLKPRKIKWLSQVHKADPDTSSSSHVWIWRLDYKESWAPKNWFFWTVILQKTLDSPLGCKEIEPVHPKGNQSWIFIGRTNVEAETPILWTPDVKSWLIWKDPDAGKDWRQEEKGTTEDEMVGRHHRLDGHEFEQAPGVDDGQRSLLCCSPWGSKEPDTTERLNWTELKRVEAELFCCVIISSGLKEKNVFCERNVKKNFCPFSWRTSDPYLLFESPRPLSSPQGSQTSYQPA